MHPSRVLILGTCPLVRKLLAELEASDDSRVQIAGVLDNAPLQEGDHTGTPWLGRLDRLTEIVDQVRADHIVVALTDRRGQLPLKPLLESRVRGIVVEDVAEFYERLTGKMAIEALTPGSLILAKGFRNHGAAEAVARFVSVVVALAGLVVLAPLLALVALAVTLDSRGPILFVQDRSGRNGRPFGLLKFRTMHPCDEHVSEWVQDNSDRITRLGKYLRRFRIDELPQLVNILRGEMNLVGPRPHPMCNQTIFMEQIAYYGLRSTVRPGVTGWAQVRYGYANNIEEETEKMRYDLYYIKNRNLRLDIRILFETVGIMLLARGSSQVHRPAVRSRVGAKPAIDVHAARNVPGAIQPVPSNQ
jgi:exopolysaccharide biosynthesis polyprenyl glycosylphosphotransferase